jgi:hypothetical protein
VRLAVNRGLKARLVGLVIAVIALALTLVALLYWPFGAVGGVASGLLAFKDKRLALIVQGLTVVAMLVAMLGAPGIIGLLGPVSPMGK